jgi:hypothetical protein
MRYQSEWNGTINSWTIIDTLTDQVWVVALDSEGAVAGVAALLNGLWG